MKAIEIAMADQQSNGNADTKDSLFARQADALVAMAQSYLAGGSEKTTSTAEYYQVVVHVDESAKIFTIQPFFDCVDRDIFGTGV